jgi:hypothetical protein
MTYRHCSIQRMTVRTSQPNSWLPNVFIFPLQPLVTLAGAMRLLRLPFIFPLQPLVTLAGAMRLRLPNVCPTLRDSVTVIKLEVEI